ncbi:helix-turn-helix domain-containing protein [Pontibacter silvestris]|uniref:Helix-turn-helix domain-containing protein n=1 Tax=Pontibacter silvestris TaxID=2305183 RepID=A0ABW4X3E1_9BACT|nr:AraC family transcriptional regulator [Pontibacter silvestris]MCC9138334.1 AraC family transcriptional regulator [Pontibacter silvestris]
MQEQPQLSSFLNDVDRNAASVYVLHEKQEQRIPLHKHKKGQLTYVEGGLAYLNTKDKTYYLPARHYVWIPAELEHFVQHSSDTLIVRNIYFNTANEAEQAFFGQMGIYPVNTLLLEMILFTEQWKGDIPPEDTLRFQFLSTMMNLLPETSKYPLPIVLPTTDSERLEPVVNFIQEHLASQLTLPLVAGEFGFSVRSLSRLFQQKMSISFLQYLKLSRVIRAIELLLESEKSVSEIAYEVGYNSVSAFSNTFYQLLGIRPTDFKGLT